MSPQHLGITSYFDGDFSLFNGTSLIGEMSLPGGDGMIISTSLYEGSHIIFLKELSSNHPQYPLPTVIPNFQRLVALVLS